MINVTIALYSFNELSKVAKSKAFDDHKEFMESGAFDDEDKQRYAKADVIDNIEANDYLFYEDGELAHITQFVAKHPKAGTTEFYFHGRTFDITDKKVSS